MAEFVVERRKGHYHLPFFFGTGCGEGGDGRVGGRAAKGTFGAGRGQHVTQVFFLNLNPKPKP